MATGTEKQSALGYALLIYMCVVVAVITLIPFEFQRPQRLVIHWTTNFSDFVTNIFLFVPVGFLFRLARRRHSDSVCLQPLMLGLFFSLAVETAQAFLPARYTQVTDVVTNGFGAWLGGVAYGLIKNRLREHPANRLFAVELPLAGLVYLLTPLMWLSGLSVGKEPFRLWLLLLLGLIGAGVIGSVFIHRFRQTGRAGYAKLTLATLLWYFTGSLPALSRFPFTVAGMGAVIALTALIIARLGAAAVSDDKRFEIPTIKRILPLYLVYLFLVTLWPTTLPVGEWPLSGSYEALATQDRFLLTFRFVEFIAAFTLLGYMIAELRGRKNESADRSLGWAFAISMAAALSIETLRTYPALAGINLLSVAVIITASVYGAAVYRLHLSAIERL
jgi:VanZ family protein